MKISKLVPFWGKKCGQFVFMFKESLDQKVAALVTGKRFVYRLPSLSLVFLVLITTFFPVYSVAMSAAQKQVFDLGIGYFDVNGDMCSVGGGESTPLVGNDSEAKIWNFFIGRGLSAAATAGIMGNFEQESGFNPTSHQTAGSWQDMGDGYNDAVGLAQWDGSRRPAIIKYLESQGIAIPSNGAPQASDQILSDELGYIWQNELNGSYKSVLTTLENPATPNTATGASQEATIFNKYYESGSDPNGVREKNAGSIFQSPPGAISNSSAGSSGGCGGSSSTIDCSSAAGDTKILCAAKAYRGIYYEYGGGHQGYAAFKAACPNPSNPPNNKPTGGPVNGDPAGLSGNPSPCGLDCSGLVSVAVDDAFGTNLMQTTYGEVADTQDWQRVGLGKVQPGDLIQPDAGHVEIITSVQGNTIYTFGSHYTTAQIGPASMSVSPSNVYLHYIGPGSSS